MSDRRLPAADVRAALRPILSTSSSPQVLADWFVGGLLADKPAARVMDLGCGRGDSVDLFRSIDPDVRWVGVDLPVSPEVAARSRTDADFVDFDGIHLPFADASFDVVFCKQVLEHVEQPHRLIPEVARVLAPQGVFVGSTSQLEPFHSRSIANLTPYGLRVLLESSGLVLRELRPGIDGLTLVIRRLLGSPRHFDRWWARASPLNRVIDGAGRLLGWDAEDRNATKLLFCGQYAFLATRAD